MKKKLLVALLTLSIGVSLNAGIFGKMKESVKDNIKDSIKETAVDMAKESYSENRKKRLDYENKTKKKSKLTKVEDSAIVTKNTLKETAVGTVGKENIEFVKRAKGHFKNGLLGKE